MDKYELTDFQQYQFTTVEKDQQGELYNDTFTGQFRGYMRDPRRGTIELIIMKDGADMAEDYYEGDILEVDKI